MKAYLYTLPGCGACGEARALLAGQGYEVAEVPIDNPLLEMGVGMLYKDRQLHAPVVVIPDKGIYITGGQPLQLLRVVSLEPEKVPA